MASYQVLPAQKQPLEMLFGGLNKGIGDMSKIYTAALLKDKLKTAKAEKPVDYGKLIPQVIAGLQPTSKLPGYSDMTQAVEGTNPGMADMLDAGEQVTNAQGQPFNNDSYDDVIRDALTTEYAPGYTRDQVKRKAVGLPANLPGDKSGGSLPGEFSADFKQAYADAAGDEDKFVSGLKKLSIKYGDHPAALNQIDKLIKLNKKDKKKAHATSGVLEE